MQSKVEVKPILLVRGKHRFLIQDCLSCYQRANLNFMISFYYFLIIEILGPRFMRYFWLETDIFQ